MPEPNREGGDPKLIALFDKYAGRLVSPGGAAALLGLSRQTIYTLCKRGELRAFRSDEDDEYAKRVPKWVYIPLDDVYAYGERVGRAVRGS
jgi:helix-turn-helix protein